MSYISDRRDVVARVITEFSWSDNPRARLAPDHAPTLATHPNGAALRILRDHCDRLVRSRAAYMSGDHVEDYAAALRARVALAAAIAERIPPARLARVTHPADLATMYREIRDHATARQAVLWDDVRDAAQDVDAKYDREPDSEPDPEPALDRPAHRDGGAVAQFDPGDVEVLVRFAAEFLAQLEVRGTAYPHVAEAYARTVTPSVSLPGETGLHALARRAHQRITAAGGAKFADYLNGLRLPVKWLPGDVAQLRDGHPEHILTVYVREVRPDTQDALVDPAHEKYCIGDHQNFDPDLCGPNSPALGEPGRPFEVAISDLHLPPVGYRPETDDDMAIVRYGTGGTDTTWNAPDRPANRAGELPPGAGTGSAAAPAVPPSDHAVSAFVVDRCSGDAVAAVLAIARMFGVAVAYLDRDWFERYLSEELGGKPFTGPQWEQIAPHLEDYDRHVSETDNLNYEFVRAVLSKAKIDLPPAGDPRSEGDVM